MPVTTQASFPPVTLNVGFVTQMLVAVIGLKVSKSTVLHKSIALYIWQQYPFKFQSSEKCISET